MFDFNPECAPKRTTAGNAEALASHLFLSRLRACAVGT